MIEKVMVDAVNYQIKCTDETIIVDGQECGADVDYNAALIRIGRRR